MVLAQTTVTFPPSSFVPVTLGFFGLGTGYLIWGPQELFGHPRRDEKVNLATGVWGIWFPGFCSFVTGILLFGGLTWFRVFNDRPLYMAALAFSAYGIHWFAAGWIRYQQADVRPAGYLAIAFIIISVLGMVVFFRSGGWPVGLLFLGLTGVYVSHPFADFKIGVRRLPTTEGRTTETVNFGERALGFFHVVTGLWLMYLTVATTLNIALCYHLPGG